MKEILESNGIIITQTAKQTTCGTKCVKLISLNDIHLLTFNTPSQTNNNSTAEKKGNGSATDNMDRTHQEQNMPNKFI